MAGLDGPERDIVALKFMGGLSNAEIARVLGTSESNAGTRLHRTITSCGRHAMSERDALIDAQLDAVDEALEGGSATATDDLERELQELALALACRLARAGSRLRRAVWASACGRAFRARRASVGCRGPGCPSWPVSAWRRRSLPPWSWRPR